MSNEDESHLAAWYIVRTATRQERKAVENLVGLHGFLTYLPCETRWKHTPGEKKKVLQPAFAGIMFVGLPGDAPEAHFRDVLDTDGVHQLYRVMTVAGEWQPFRLSYAEVKKVMDWEASGEFDRTRPDKPTYRPGIGATVKICGGMWQERLATVMELQGNRARVMLSGLGGGKLWVGVEQVEPAFAPVPTTKAA